MRTVGKVLWISKRDGNGIIVNESYDEFYFDKSTCPMFETLNSKDIVSFQADRYNDILVAKNVTVRELTTIVSSHK